MSARILFVDDDDGTRTVMQHLLAMEGHQVDVCSGPAEALSRLASTEYDLLITDHVMVGMSGLDLTRAARRSYPNMRCFVLSGFTKPSDEELGDTVWVSKPVDIDQLLIALAL